MSNQFHLIPGLFSDMRLESQAGTLTFRSTIFSLSAVLSENGGHSIAELERTSWWKYKFDLKTSDGCRYKCYKKLGEFFIEGMNCDVLFHTQGTMDFYLNGSKRVTSLEATGQFKRSFSLTVNDADHEVALLIVSCLMYELYGRSV